MASKKHNYVIIEIEHTVKKEATMSSFSSDKKWMEAKKVVGDMNWVEIVSYYRSINGTNVFVYVIGEGNKRLIVDVIDDDNILLINKDGDPEIDTYENVMNSRKEFKYSEDFGYEDFYLNDTKITIPIENIHRKS